MARRSESCREPKSGIWLWEYASRKEALRSRTPDALIVREFEVYECLKCGAWHRRPIQDDAPIPTDALCMHCMTREGLPKQSYPSPDAAMEAAFLLSEGGPALSVYVCPLGRGWHLTKG